MNIKNREGLNETSNLCEREKMILSNMVLVPSQGIDVEVFRQWCGLETLDEIETLVAAGWMENNNNIIEMNSVNEGVIIQDCLIQNPGICDTFLKNIVAYLENENEAKDVRFLTGVGDKLIHARLNTEFAADVLYRIPPFIWDFGYIKESIVFRKQALMIFSKLYGEKSLAVAMVQNGLGKLYHMQGDFNRAVKCWREAYEIRKRIFGSDNPYTVESLITMGEVYCLEKRFDLAEQCWKDSYEITKKHLGEDHIKTAVPLNNLGSLYFEQGKLELAEKCALEVYKIWKKGFGEVHECVANALNGLGTIYRGQEKYASAEACYQKAIEIYKKLDEQRMTKESSCGIATTLYNLAALHIYQQQFDLAEPYMEQAYEIRKKILGDIHVETQEAWKNLCILRGFHNKNK